MRTVPQQIRDEAVRRVAAGEVPKAVGVDLGVSTTTVNAWCRLAGCGVGRGVRRGACLTKIPPEKIARAVELRKLGWRQAAIAADLGVGQATVHKWLSAAGFHGPAKAARKPTPPKPAPPKPPRPPRKRVRTDHERDYTRETNDWWIKRQRRLAELAKEMQELTEQGSRDGRWA